VFQRQPDLLKGLVDQNRARVAQICDHHLERVIDFAGADRKTATTSSGMKIAVSLRADPLNRREPRGARARSTRLR